MKYEPSSSGVHPAASMELKYESYKNVDKVDGMERIENLWKRDRGEGRRRWMEGELKTNKTDG